MPELPEVETVRADLERHVAGRRIVAASVTGRRTVRRQRPDELVAAVRGRTVTAVDRHGKYLLVRLDDGAVLVVHLRMSGQLLLVAPEARSTPSAPEARSTPSAPGTGTGGTPAPRAPHTHVVLELDDASELHFVDPRTFGELFVTADLLADGRPAALGALGLDPVVDGLTPAQLVGLLARRRTSVKAFLLDQHVLAGVGNLYADEICFRAGLRPARRTDTVSDGEAAVLCDAVLAVLGEAVRLRGSTLADARYRDLSGGYGAFQDHHAVYGRAGEPCVRCGTDVVRERIAGRSAHYCPSCQS